MPPPHITGGGGPVPSGWEPPGSLNRSAARALILGTTLNDTRSTFTRAHDRNVYHGGEIGSPQKFTKLTGPAGVNQPHDLEEAARIRLPRRALSRNRGRP
jgi:hypothetical protein